MNRSMVTKTRRGGAALGGATAAGLIGLSTVFACTSSMGPLTISPTSGRGGTVITTSASGIKANATYRLLTGAPGADCMGSTKVLVASIPTDASGAWTNVTAKIPSRAKRGPNPICGMENTPVRNQTGTNHVWFTVV